MRAASLAALAPIVFFPGYGTTLLRATVSNQHTVAGCPASGSFGDGIGSSEPSTYDQACHDKLLTPRYAADPGRPFAQRITRPPGVKVTIPHYGETSTAPVYTQLFDALHKAGYVPGKDLRVAGYDFYLTPDLGGFMKRTVRLIESTYRSTGGRRVRLVGHSNGPLYAQYLLDHRSAAWKRKYIQGFTTIAGNMRGQGSTWSTVFVGTPSATRLAAMSPATWMSAPDPAYFGRREVVIEDRATGTRYTPKDTSRLLSDAKLGFARPLAEHYLGFVKFTGPKHVPNVDVTAEIGSGLDTTVGISLPDLSLGQAIDPATATYFTLPGDGNQEAITNDSVLTWRTMRCHRFRIHDNPGVAHVALAVDKKVIQRLLADAARKPTVC